VDERALSAEEILAAIRGAGGRVTATKRALVAQLVAAPGHLTAEELTTGVQRSAPATSPSTVYRNLEELEALGIVVHAHLGRHAAVYHLAGVAHGHLLCANCGATIEVPASAFESLVRAARRQYGFEVDRHHLALSGRCANCSGRRTRGPATGTDHAAPLLDS
jgi:Fur family ferric uptake transcriptional regulator